MTKEKMSMEEEVLVTKEYSNTDTDTKETKVNKEEIEELKKIHKETSEDDLL